MTQDAKAPFQDAPIVFGRECGECSMCCKTMEITELSKPAGRWCNHVKKRHGCAIYKDRPPSCQAFGCGYLHWPVAGDHWFPKKSKMVIVAEDENRMAVHVDPSTPMVWKNEPYYADLKDWAYQAAEHDQQLVVSIARRMFAILPDRDVDLGVVGEDEIVLTGKRKDGSYAAMKLKADDPMIKGMPYGRVLSL